MAPFSRHQLVYSDLLRRLQSGEWKVGDKFPTVDDFKGSYDLSRGSIFKGIRQLADEGYLSVSKGRSGTVVARTSPLQNIGLLMNEASLQPQKTPFPYVLGEKISAKLQAEGFSVRRYIERKGTEFAGRASIEGLADDLKKRSLRGLIMANCDFDQYMDTCPIWQKYQVPHVKIGGEYGTSKSRIEFDADASIKTALQYFSRNGRSEVAFISSGLMIGRLPRILPSFPTLHSRPEWMLEATGQPSHEENGFELMRRLWSIRGRPSALFVSDDIVAKGVVQAVVQLGIQVPRDLIITYLATSGANVFYPIKMPKIEYDMDEIVGKAIGLLKHSIYSPGMNAEERPAKETVRPKLMP